MFASTFNLSQPPPRRRLFWLAPLFLAAVGMLFISSPALAVAAPTVTGLSPTSGPTAGGTSVVITGTDFTGTTSVMFGSTGASFITNTNMQITAIAPAAIGPGPVFVRVTTGNGTSATAAGNQYIYVGAVPQVTGLNPTSGPVGGGNTVILTGSGFTGTTSVMFGPTGASFFVANDSQISAVAPGALTPGIVNVTVTTANGTSPISVTNQYSYILGSPVVSSLSPASGPVSGGTVVLITGSGFTNAFAVTFSQVSVQFTINSDSQITAISPAASGPGTIYVRVSTPNGTSASGAGSLFTYTGIVYSVVVTGVSPSVGPPTGGTSVTISGSGFTGTSLVLFGPAGASFTVNSDSQITAVAPPGSGPVYVRVTAGGVTSPISSYAAFTYGFASPPNVTRISPDSGPTSGGTVIIVYGNGFTGTTAVLFSATAAASFTINSDTQLTVVSPPYAAGAVGIGVYTPAGYSPNTPADAFTYLSPVPPPPPGPYACPAIPLWTNDLAYGSIGGGFYWDPVSGLVWTGQRGWHAFSPRPPRIPVPLWVNALTYGSIGGGFWWDSVSGQVWTAERGWHLYSPQGCLR